MMLLETVSTVFIPHFFHQAEWYFSYRNVMRVLRVLVFVSFLFFYARNYLRLKKNNSFYTLQVYLLWGFVMFCIPILNSCFMGVAKTVFGDALYVGRGPQLIVYAIPGILELFSFIFALLATGIMLDKKVITVISFCLFPIILMLYYVHIKYFIPTENDTVFMLEIYDYINTRTIMGKAIVLLGYVIMGILLHPKKRGKYGA
jgi:hypothetical protein